MKFLKRRMKRLRDLRHDGGNITIIFALASIPMFLGLGAAVDYGYYAARATALRAAADSALMAVMSSDRFQASNLTGSNLATAQKLARDYLVQNFKRNPGDPDIPNPTLTVEGQAVRLRLQYTVPTPMMSALKLAAGVITVDTKAVNTTPASTEIALVVDTHRTPAARNTTPLTGASSSVVSSIKDFIKTLYGGKDLASAPDSPQIRLALVPYSGAVKLDTNTATGFKADWIDTNNSNPLSRVNFSDATWNNYKAWTYLQSGSNGQNKWTWNGCVESRAGSYAVTDERPVSGSTLFPAYFAPDEVWYSLSTEGYQWYFNSYFDAFREIRGIPFYDNYNNLVGAYTTTLYRGNSLQSLRQKNVNKYIFTDNSSIPPEQPDGSQITGPFYNCPNAKSVPLTYDRSTVETGLNSIAQRGEAHLVPEGLAWAWRMLSPTEPYSKVIKGPNVAAAEIAPYGDKVWSKAIILIVRDNNNVGLNGDEPATFGSGSHRVYGYNQGTNNLNGTTYSAYGYGTEGFNLRFGLSLSHPSNTSGPNLWNPTVNANTDTICANIKNAGIRIFTVGVKLADTTFKTRMQNCASAATDFYDVSDVSQLTTKLNEIAAKFKPAKLVKIID